MRCYSRYSYLVLAFIQVLISFLVFRHYFLSPAAYLFDTYGDGLKNYFTLQSYVSGPASASGGLLHYAAFAYPFGDYVFYTDNTPLFSVPFRWYCTHISDISHLALPLFNWFIISNMLVCSLLCWWLFRQLLGPHVLCFLMAIILPWTTAQLLRIPGGHFNLSLSVLPVTALALAVLWQRSRNASRQLLLTGGILLFCIGAFLLHGYYMAIITIFAASLLFLCSWYRRREQGGYFRLALAAGIAPLTLLLILLLLHWGDPYLAMRKDGAMGYDFGEQKTIYAQLFTHYAHQRLFFPLYSSKSADALELSSYLGNAGLYSLAGLFAGILISPAFRRRFLSVQARFFSDPLRKSLFLSGLLLLLISFGEHYTSNKAAYRFSLPSIAAFSLPEQLVLLAFCGGISYYTWRSRHRLRSSFKAPLKEHILVILGAAVLVYLMVAQYTVTVINILNPFWYLHFLTDRVEQFRSIARFNWPFYWCFYIWILYTLLALFRDAGPAAMRALLLAVLLLGGWELWDNGRHLYARTQQPNPFTETALKPFRALHIDFRQYQAIVPLPYFLVGSEDYDYTLDDDNAFSTYIMQLLQYSHLPTMACKLSRTPPAFSRQLLALLADDQLSPGLRSLMTDKPLLLVVDRALLTDTNAAHIPGPQQPVARAGYFRTLNLVSRHRLQPIDSMGNKLFYSWRPL